MNIDQHVKNSNLPAELPPESDLIDDLTEKLGDGKGSVSVSS
jgi:hypothetical protein